MDDMVIGLAELRDTDADRVGAKVATLAGLTAAGLAVPTGFVITGAVYEQLVAEGPIGADLQQLYLEALATDDRTTQFALLCSRMQNLVRELVIESPVREAILAAYRQLGPDSPVAVRPSPIGAEAARPSVAALTPSRIGVTGPAALLAAVIESWASQFSGAVLARRAGRDTPPHRHPAMAVLVQTMVQTRVSGVAFTADPATGRRDRVVIDAVPGPSAALTRADARPDTYIFDTDGPTLLRIRPWPAVPAETVAVERDAGILSSQDATAVAELALAVSARLGGAPQDVEWAFDENRLWLLRARPITLLPDRAHRTAASEGVTI
ncbi:PEP/pyruvate-binding domain-containing protein [Nocardia amikacinitolerans]|uniref:PEP/pyruvate-binding domain-containing protein n=1 Tax=Nocardia amikacinitolerans TaxID=756689 RepID=UPI0020A45593|nr:PEP/pyruvate-binding domain-containing protein [Nocardia amikacinitolerans]MCP2293541.1 Pyruvate phosphate dikinase, PEP/pyruvate binding domain [Nocardia amikacinitolerans]